MNNIRLSENINTEATVPRPRSFAQVLEGRVIHLENDGDSNVKKIVCAKIREVSICFFTTLNLSGLGITFNEDNHLQNFSTCLLLLQNLETLNLDHNEIKNLRWLNCKLKIKSLSLANNKVEEIVKIRFLKNLESLDLHGNRIKEVPHEIGQLIRLRNLNFYDNNIESISEEITKLVNLEKLDVDENPSITLPHLASLVKLKELGVTNEMLQCALQKWVNVFFENSQDINLALKQKQAATTILQTYGRELHSFEIENTQVFTEQGFFADPINELSLWDMELTTLPKVFGLDIFVLSRFANLDSIDFTLNKLTEIPDSIGNLKSLKQLKLANNRLKSLPDSIGEISGLNVLDVTENCLSKLPESLWNLNQLEVLYFDSNPITEISENIGNLMELNSLGISNVPNGDLPNNLSTLQKLESLFVTGSTISNFQSFNYFLNLTTLDLPELNIKTFPTQILGLAGLRSLCLSGNSISTIPDEIDRLTFLNNLNISNNKFLESLPMTLGNCHFLIGLDIEGTKIPERQKVAILERAKRLPGTLLLSQITPLWITYSQQEYDLEFLSNKEHFSLEQQTKIVDWLLRLVSCKDFSNNRVKLAKLVCDILLSLNPLEGQKAQEFKEVFFMLLDDNLSDCADRSAMLLNLIYTEWKISIMHRDAPDSEKLELLGAIARTLMLRKVIQNRIIHQNKEESVEIYLYYESKLRNVLKLETAIHSMFYSEIGNRGFNENELVSEVVAGYKDVMINFSAVEKILEKNEQYNQEKNQAMQHFASILEELITSHEGHLSKDNDQQFLVEVDRIKNLRLEILNNLKKKYLNQKL